MRSTLAAIALIAFVVGVSAPAAAGPKTDYELFIKKLEKFGPLKDGDLPELNAKPKALCVCQDGGSENGLGGLLVLQKEGNTRVRVGCWVRTYSFTTGNLTGAIRCDTFEVLSK